MSLPVRFIIIVSANQTSWQKNEPRSTSAQIPYSVPYSINSHTQKWTALRGRSFALKAMEISAVRSLSLHSIVLTSPHGTTMRIPIIAYMRNCSLHIAVVMVLTAVMWNCYWNTVTPVTKLRICFPTMTCFVRRCRW